MVRASVFPEPGAQVRSGADARPVVEEKVAALGTWQSSNVFDDRERAALEYAEAITFTDRHVTDELMAKLRNYFDEDAVVELTGIRP